MRRGNSAAKTCLRPSSLKMCASENDRLLGCAGDDGARPKTGRVGADHPDADHRLPRLGIGRCRLSRRAQAILVVPRVRLNRVIEPVVPPRSSSSILRGARIHRGLRLLGCGVVEPREVGRRLEARGAVDLSPGAIDHDERRHALDMVAPGQLGIVIDVDRLDRITHAGQLLDGFSHLLARTTPFGMEVKQDGLRARFARRAKSCGDQCEQQGSSAHAARTPFPRRCPHAVVAVTAERV